MTRIVALLIASLVPAIAAADEVEARDFARVDQTGGLGQGDFGASYSLDSARAVKAVEGSSNRGAYRGVSHRLAAAYGIFDWLTVGFDQSIKQEQLGQAQIGMFSPIVRGRLDELGVPAPGLGVYVQGRIRITGRRPDSIVSGVSYDREVGGVHLVGLLGYERTVGPQPVENGFRSEVGAGKKLGADWRLSAEAWGHMTWDSVGRQSGLHAGPALQRRFGPVTAGLQLGIGLEERLAALTVDAIGLCRIGVGF